MNYVVFDLEFNQPFNFTQNSRGPNPRCPFEIIDLGAVKLDENLNEISTFNSLVKPTLYKRLHPYVKKITGIKKGDLKDALPFRDVYNDFTKLLDEESILCVWGASDIKELYRNIEFYKLDESKLPDKFINIQLHASKLLISAKNGEMGLKNAVEMLNIPMDVKFHSAFYDAWYTAEIFKKIDKETVKPVIYTNINEKPKIHERPEKSIHNFNKLYEHVEKTFSRKLTKEERSMVKLAYKMGLVSALEKQQ